MYLSTSCGSLLLSKTNHTGTLPFPFLTFRDCQPHEFFFCILQLPPCQSRYSGIFDRVMGRGYLYRDFLPQDLFGETASAEISAGQDCSYPPQRYIGTGSVAAEVPSCGRSFHFARTAVRNVRRISSSQPPPRMMSLKFHPSEAKRQKRRIPSAESRSRLQWPQKGCVWVGMIPTFPFPSEKRYCPPGLIPSESLSGMSGP